MLDFPNQYVNNLRGTPVSDSSEQTLVLQGGMRQNPMQEHTPPALPGNRIDGAVMPQSLPVPEKQAFALDATKQFPAGVDFPAIQDEANLEADFLNRYLSSM